MTALYLTQKGVLPQAIVAIRKPPLRSRHNPLVTLVDEFHHGNMYAVQTIQRMAAL
jgi:hypothetical protein